LAQVVMSRAKSSEVIALRSLLIVWLAWAALMLGFQALVQERFSLQRPDQALDWTAAETGPDARSGHPYLSDAFLAGHAWWDSEYYISIALAGYDDPAMRAAGPASKPDAPQAALKRDRPDWVSLNHAFLPAYPYATRLLAWPTIGLGARPVAAAVGAGVAVSLLGTLAAMLALADLASEPAEGRRAAFYLLVWPGAVFLAQVYSEGLFLGLSFGALAMLRRRAWPWAAALAAGAVFARATGGLLLIPFLWTWIAGGGAGALLRRTPRAFVAALLALSPLAAYLVWRLAFGADFQFVETRYFGRGLLELGPSLDSWRDAWSGLLRGPPPAVAYRALDIAAFAAALAASAAFFRRDPPLVVYGLAVLAVAATSGSSVGVIRYALAVPALFLAPAILGRHSAFDQAWTLAGALGLAVATTAFTFGFWAG
jgi:hypothetical protein